METKECRTCNIVKSANEFYTNNTVKSIDESNDEFYKTCKNTRNNCISCERIKCRDNKNTQKGYFVNILSVAKKSAYKKGEKNRLEAGIFDLTIEDIRNLWNKQKGLCYYSNIPMITRTCCDWKMSIQRLDDTKGYIPDNIVLSCLEFNNSTKWTPDKIDVLFKSYNTTSVNFEFKHPKKKPEKIILNTIDGIEYHKCTDCGIFKEKHSYIKNDRACAICRTKRRNLYTSTPKGHMQKLVRGARKSTKKRKNKKTTKKRDSDLDIDFDYLVNLYHKQDGRCAYSNIPLNFGSYKDNDWILSLERINPLKGYTKDNVCLIALEFNTSDYTCMSANETVEGSSAWSKEKFEYFKKVYLENRSAIEA
jgi:hypothetical protein